MLDKMKASRAGIMGRAEVLRSVPGSGYHDNDPLGPSKHPDPVGRRDAKLEEHVVCFRLPFEMCFVEPDAERCLQAVSKFYGENADLLKEQRLDQTTRTLIETAKEYTERPLQGGCFIVRGAQWNDVLAILHFQDIGVTITAVK